MTLRLATWNVEWFDQLFDRRGDLALTDDWSARYKITKARQLEAIAGVLRHMRADAVLIIEAPDSSGRKSGQAALERFADWAGLATTRAIIGFANDTRQEIALLYDPARITAIHRPGDSPSAPRFDTEFDYDLDTDLRAERVVWSKPPLELDITVEDGRAFHLIGVHAKSKAAHGAQDAKEALRISILNRRKQLAQCIWLRARVDALLAEGRALVVAGDFNDGPGLDRFESLFGRSGVEIVLGDGASALHDPSALPPRMGMAAPHTARFWDNDNKRWLNALLDFAMVSRDLRPGATWQILHPFNDPEALDTPPLQRDLLDASDHFPVILDLPAADANI